MSHACIGTGWTTGVDFCFRAGSLGSIGARVQRNKAAILASTALYVGFASAGEAASLPGHSWNGVYVGANLGYSWGKTDTSVNVLPFEHSPFFFSFPGGSSAARLEPNGVIGGGQIGYNWHFAPSWLAGIEADWQWSGQKRSGLSGFSIVTTDCTEPSCTLTNATDITAKLSWFGTVRGRVGVLSNNILFYGTGGIAYGRVSVSGANTFSTLDNEALTIAYSNVTPFSYSKTKVGWVGGFGIEGAFGLGNWTWKAEYLHMDLGSIGGGAFSVPATAPCDPCGTPVVNFNTTRFTDDIVRFGVNYRFGGIIFPL